MALSPARRRARFLAYDSGGGTGCRFFSRYDEKRKIKQSDIHSSITYNRGRTTSSTTRNSSASSSITTNNSSAIINSNSNGGTNEINNSNSSSSESTTCSSGSTNRSSRATTCGIKSTLHCAAAAVAANHSFLSSRPRVGILRYPPVHARFVCSVRLRACWPSLMLCSSCTTTVSRLQTSANLSFDTFSTLPRIYRAFVAAPRAVYHSPLSSSPSSLSSCWISLSFFEFYTSSNSSIGLLSASASCLSTAARTAGTAAAAASAARVTNNNKVSGATRTDTVTSTASASVLPSQTQQILGTGACSETNTSWGFFPFWSRLRHWREQRLVQRHRVNASAVGQASVPHAAGSIITITHGDTAHANIPQSCSEAGEGGKNRYLPTQAPEGARNMDLGGRAGAAQDDDPPDAASSAAPRSPSSFIATEDAALYADDTARTVAAVAATASSSTSTAATLKAALGYFSSPSSATASLIGAFRSAVATAAATAAAAAASRTSPRQVDPCASQLREMLAPQSLSDGSPPYDALLGLKIFDSAAAGAPELIRKQQDITRRLRRVAGNADPFSLAKPYMAVLDSALLLSVKTVFKNVDALSSHLLTAPGKRFRPVLLALVRLALLNVRLLEEHAAKKRATAATKTKHPGAEAPAAAVQQPLKKGSELRMLPVVELIHTASIMHDDVIDGADTRRGHLTAHRRFDNKKAILGGDFLLARASAIVASCGSFEVMMRIARVVESLVEGELLQTLGYPSDFRSALTLHLTKTYHKTASLIAESCACVALLGGLSRRWVEWSHQLGTAIGIAFQLYDDELDVTASSSSLGKPALNDLRTGLATAPVLMAAHEAKEGGASAAARKLLHVGAARERLSETEIQDILRSIHEGAALPRARLLTALYVSRVVELLEVMMEFSRMCHSACGPAHAASHPVTGGTHCEPAVAHCSHAGEAGVSAASSPTRTLFYHMPTNGEVPPATSYAQYVASGGPLTSGDSKCLHTESACHYDCSPSAGGPRTWHATCGRIHAAKAFIRTPPSHDSTTAAPAANAQRLRLARFEDVHTTPESDYPIRRGSSNVEEYNRKRQAGAAAQPSEEEREVTCTASGQPKHNAAIAGAPPVAALPVWYRFTTSSKARTAEATKFAGAASSATAFGNTAGRVAATRDHTEENGINAGTPVPPDHTLAHGAALRAVRVDDASPQNGQNTLKHGVGAGGSSAASTTGDDAAAAAEMVRTCCSGVAALLLLTLSRKAA